MAERYPFTLSQWKELERQTMIFKYMMACVPVPHELLFPLTAAISSETTATSRIGNGSSSSTFLISPRFEIIDPETGRCRRTDGKKWRCTRDAAPDQKYCDRHLHRGRPRSRKPVEPQQPPNSSSSSLFHTYSYNDHQEDSSSSFSFPSPPSPFHITTRKRNSESQTEFQISDIVSADLRAAREGKRPQQWSPGPGNPMNTREFIDAREHEVEKDVRKSQTLTDLTLSMAMVSGDVIDRQIYGVETSIMDYRPQRVSEERSTWPSPMSWVVAPGGPLAEVLRPSCVAPASVEDGSGSGSESMVAARCEAGFPWFTQV